MGGGCRCDIPFLKLRGNLTYPHLLHYTMNTSWKTLPPSLLNDLDARMIASRYVLLELTSDTASYIFNIGAFRILDGKVYSYTRASTKNFQWSVLSLETVCFNSFLVVFLPVVESVTSKIITFTWLESVIHSNSPMYFCASVVGNRISLHA